MRVIQKRAGGTVSSTMHSQSAWSTPRRLATNGGPNTVCHVRLLHQLEGSARVCAHQLGKPQTWTPLH